MGNPLHFFSVLFARLWRPRDMPDIRNFRTLHGQIGKAAEPPDAPCRTLAQGALLRESLPDDADRAELIDQIGSTPRREGEDDFPRLTTPIVRTGDPITIHKFITEVPAKKLSDEDLAKIIEENKKILAMVLSGEMEARARLQRAKRTGAAIQSKFIELTTENPKFQSQDLRRWDL